MPYNPAKDEQTGGRVMQRSDVTSILCGYIDWQTMLLIQFSCCCINSTGSITDDDDVGQSRPSHTRRCIRDRDGELCGLNKSEETVKGAETNDPGHTLEIMKRGQGRHFNFFLGPNFFLIPPDYWKIGKKQHFICSNLTFIVPFFLISLSLFLFFSFFFLSFFSSFSLGPPAPSNDASERGAPFDYYFIIFLPLI